MWQPVLELATVTLVCSASAEGAGTPQQTQEESSTASEQPLRWSPSPVIMYAPETSLMLGGMLVFSFGEDGKEASLSQRPRRSAVMVALAGSLKKQAFLSLQPDLYLHEAAWHISCATAVAYFPNTIFPIGNNTPADSGENVTALTLETQPVVAHAVTASLEAGMAGNVGYVDYLETETGGLIERSAVPGSDGGFSIGVGPIIAWDNRDNNLATYSGGRHSAFVLFYRAALGGDYDFNTLNIDLRHFFEISSEHILALQLYAQFTSDGAPHAKLAKLGGGQRLRGLFEGRFTARHMISTQAEYRFPVWQRFRGAAFIGVGRVANQIQKLALTDLRVAGGLGLRFALIPEDRANLRLDVGVASTGDVNMYFAFNEAF